MKNRRQFIKNAFLGSLMSAVPFKISKASPPVYPKDLLKQAKGDDQLFRLIRQSLLLPKDLIYLNTGSLGPSPAWLIHRISYLMTELESNPVGNNWGPLGQQMEAVRKKVADFINASKEEIILTRNTTEGINLIGSCLKLNKGDEILTTTHEHGGGENGLKYLANKEGAELRKMQLPMPVKNKGELIDFITGQISNKTKVLMLSHINTLTGFRMPFSEIASITRSKGIVLIADGAQAVGMIDIDVQQLGVDAYATSGHKWLMGPKETGFVFIRKEIQEKVKDVFTQSGYAAYSASSGTRNVAMIIGQGEILDWHMTIGKSKIQDRCRKLAAYCRKHLEELNGIEIISPSSPDLTGGMVSILLKDAKKQDVFQKMRENQIVIKNLPTYNALRFSTHMFNTEEDIDRMVLVLKELV